jgi:hypothetical protein
MSKKIITYNTNNIFYIFIVTEKQKNIAKENSVNNILAESFRIT